MFGRGSLSILYDVMFSLGVGTWGENTLAMGYVLAAGNQDMRNLSARKLYFRPLKDYPRLKVARSSDSPFLSSKKEEAGKDG